MGYEIYKGEIRRVDKNNVDMNVPPQIRIAKDGGIFFNKGTVQLIDIQLPCFCTLYYEEGSHRVGFKFSKKRTAKYMRKVSYKEGVTPFISGRGFFNYHAIDTSVSKVYTPWYDEQSKLFVIQLDSTLGEEEQQ